MAKGARKAVSADTSEAEQRLRKILQGAFSGPPTSLKDIPKRNGESRSIARKKHYVSRASAKTAQPGKKSPA
jgi:hypothetical protein